MKNRRNNLDEMQEQKLRRIESGGFWIVYWGLLAVMLIHLFRGGLGSGSWMLPEWLLFMGLSLYIVVRCLRGGIWDRRLKANFRTNLIASLVAGAAMGIINTILLMKNYGNALSGAVAGGVVIGVGTFLLCLAALTLCVSILKRRQRKLEEEPEEDD